MILRPAIEKDVPLVLQLIRELADYEKLLHEVVATEEILFNSLFIDPKGPEVLIAEESGEPVGFVLFFHNFSTFLGRKGIYIEDLYVRESHQRMGYGQKILAEVCRIALERNCGRVEWFVLDWNERAINFYKKIGAKPQSEWTTFRLDEGAIEKLSMQER